MAKRINVAALPAYAGTFYPPPYDKLCRARERRVLGDIAGLSQFGINLLRLPPGVWSSQRHWHSSEDEFVYVLSGEVVLVTDAGEEVLKAGDCAGFKAGDRDGHHLQNRAASDALLLEIGTRAQDDRTDYPDIDMICQPGGKTGNYTHRDGTPYTGVRWRGPNDKD